MTSFKGFSNPNYTQFPNEYVDYTISPECILTKTQMRIMNLFFRETFGWQDKFRSLVLSVTDIQAILGLGKKNTVIDALNGLVDELQFLESIEVRRLPKIVRDNIQKQLGKTLQPSQKLYRLNLIDRQNKSWDFAYETHINVQELKEQIKSSNQKDTTFKSSNQKDTTGSNQKDTTSEAESVGAVSWEDSLKKDLKKFKEKEEEEEAPPYQSELIKFLLSKDITLENANKFESRLLAKGLTGYTNEQILKSIEWSLNQFLEGKCDEPYIYAVGRLERVLDDKVKEVFNKPKQINQKKQNQHKKSIRTEKLPSWFNEDEQNDNLQQVKDDDDYKQRVQALRERLMKYKAN